MAGSGCGPGRSRHRMVFEQEGGRLKGVHQTLFLNNPLTGQVRGNEIVVTSLHPFEGTHLAYRFAGAVRGDEITGTVELGSSGQSAPGPLNQREYGTVSWQGRKVSTEPEA